MEGRRVGEGEDMRGKSLMGEDYDLGGRSILEEGLDFCFGYFLVVGSLILGSFGEPLQGAPGCWGFWAWGPGFLTVSWS
jgi:hypothetical protein